MDFFQILKYVVPIGLVIAGLVAGLVWVYVRGGVRSDRFENKN